jgi:putative flavoprotein involved in K+ transport
VNRIDTLVVGGGQAGLAMSRCLSDRSIDHVVLERGRIAERWRSERWDSLRLLTPNWQTRLPGFRYDGSEVDGFMSMPELVGFFERYAMSFGAHVETDTTVLAIEPAGAGFHVATNRGAWRARHVVIATGYSDVPLVPELAAHVSMRLTQVVPTGYRNPTQLPPGGVLVVGASATGVQLAEEIQSSGRPVTLAVGRHMRLPRQYRGRDIMWWLDAMGVFDDTAEGVFNLHTSQHQPSLQLVGRPDVTSLNLATLRQHGVRLVGRLAAADGERVWLDDDLIATTAASDAKLAQLLARIDSYIAAAGLTAAAPEPFEPTWTSARESRAMSFDLDATDINTVLWATGFRRRYPWLKVPVLDRAGDIIHRSGITPVPGLFVLGMHFQRKRKSAFIDGVGEDAALLADRIASRAAFAAAAAC